MLEREFLEVIDCTHGIDNPIGNANGILQVEVADGVYKDIKSVYFLSDPDRTIIRLENQ